MEYSEDFVKKLLPNRPKDSNKGTFGSVLNIAGSAFYTGAAYFSSISPLLVGAGRSTLASTNSAIDKIASLSPDIIYFPLKETKNGIISKKSIVCITENLSNYDVISVGCGLSARKEAFEFFKKLLPILKLCGKPVVIDADGLNLLAKTDDKKLNNNFILTPHPLELSRLLTVSVEQILSKPDFWIEKAVEKFNCTVILKIHKTIVQSPQHGDFYVNNTGNSALSHGGSGDVLCGMITGLLAQHLNQFEASCLAVYLHGLAAEIASKELSEYSTITSNLIECIPYAIKTLIK